MRLLTGRTFWRTYAEPAIGLAEIVTSDGPVGLRGERWDERDTAINIPSPTEQRVEIALDQRLFEHWDTTERDCMLGPWTYTVQVGFASADLPLRADIPIG